MPLSYAPQPSPISLAALPLKNPDLPFSKVEMINTGALAI